MADDLEAAVVLEDGGERAEEGLVVLRDEDSMRFCRPHVAGTGYPRIAVPADRLRKG
jgi:hypothetical protein